MAYYETTSERVARIASLGTHSPQLLTLDEIQTVCASALTQAPDHSQRNALSAIRLYSQDPGSYSNALIRK